MKKLLLLLVVMSGVPVVLAAQTTSWRKTDDDWALKNSISLTTSLFGWTNYNGVGFAPITLEYDRMIHDRLSVSALGLFTHI